MTSPEHIQKVKTTLNKTQQKMARINNNMTSCSKSPKGTTSCKKTIHIGIFFDGTDNNMKRDYPKSHSNIVSLFNAYEVNTAKGYYSLYVPGVGTPFSIGGENGELAGGKSNGEGGGKRLYYAMFELFNFVNHAVNKNRLIAETIIKNHLKVADFPDGNKAEFRNKLFGTNPDKYFWPFIELLNKAIKIKEPTAIDEAINNKKPVIDEINISVFGFSRGAAKARAFCNLFHKAVGESGVLCGIKTNFNFLGLFDTVASVGLPLSAPLVGGVAVGLQGWADASMKIHDNVKRCVHFVAAHEFRVSFPLSSIMYKGEYSEKFKEVVYPGVHSDLGGGYAVGDQGKSVKGREYLFSQIPLRHMYEEACNHVLPLNSYDDMTNDFKVASQVELLATKYIENYNKIYNVSKHTKGSDFYKSAEIKKLQRIFHVSQSLYLGWRWHIQQLSMKQIKLLPFYLNAGEQKSKWLKKSEESVSKLGSYSYASKQEKQDMLEANLDYMLDMWEIFKQLEKEPFAYKVDSMTTYFPPKYIMRKLTGTVDSNPYTCRRFFLRYQYIDLIAYIQVVLQLRGNKLDPQLCDFFDGFIHDSHAGFYVVGPRSVFEKREFYNNAKRKVDHDNGWNSWRPFGQSNNRRANPFERHVVQHRGNYFPVMTDENRKYFYIEKFFSMIVQKSMARSPCRTLTRREAGGHVKERYLMDSNAG